MKKVKLPYLYRDTAPYAVLNQQEPGCPLFILNNTDVSQLYETDPFTLIFAGLC